MDIYVSVDNQKLRVATNLKNLISGTQQFIRFIFELSEDWDGLHPFVQFRQDDVGYNQYLDAENSAYLPSEIQPGTCTMMLYGSNGTIKATTNYITFTIDENYLLVDANSTNISQSLYDQLIAMVENVVDTEVVQNTIRESMREEVQRLVDSGEIGGLSIPDGSIEMRQLHSTVQDKINNPAGMDQLRSDLADGIQEAKDYVDDALENFQPSNAVIVDQLVSPGDENTDYYLLNSDGDYIHYRWIVVTNQWTQEQTGSYQQIGPDVYTKNQVDSIISGINTTISGINTTVSGLSTSVSNINTELNDSHDLDATHSYSSVGNAIRGAYNLAKSYTDDSFANFRSFDIVFVDELPDENQQEMTFYLVPNNKGGYDKYWWVKPDEEDEFQWDVFGGQATLTEVVASLPPIATADPDTDYILNNNDGCFYYKKIDGEWKMIAGSKVEICNALPQSGNQYTDYYVKISGSDKYLHYRWIIENNLGAFHQIGASAVFVDSYDNLPNPGVSDIDYFVLMEGTNGNKYTHYRWAVNKYVQITGALTYSISEIDSKISNLSQRIDANESNITDLSGSLSQITNDIADINTELSATYGLDLVEDSEQSRYQLKLYKEDLSGDRNELSVVAFAAGGGGGGGQTSSTSISLTMESREITVTAEDKVEITFECHTVTQEGDDAFYILTGTLLKGYNVLVSNINLEDGENTLDITKYLSVGKNRLNLRVSNGDSSSTFGFTVEVINMYIDSKSSDEYTIEAGSELNFTYTPYGNVEKTVYVEFDGELVQQYTTKAVQLQTYVIPPQEHGHHLIKVWEEATIGDKVISPAPLCRDFIWYDPLLDENGQYKPAVIGCIYRYDYYGKVNMNQYDVLPIVYNVYDPKTKEPKVERYVDGVLISTNTHDRSKNTWNFAATDPGEHTLRLKCGETIVDIVVDVKELEDVDISPVMDGLEIDFNPVGISNDSSNRLWSNNKYHMTVNDHFDWANGGYKVDDNGDSYFLIKAGDRAYFDYRMFRGNRNNNVMNTGAEMKIVFMTEKVQLSDAVWFTNVAEEDVGGKTQQIGIQLGAHEGWLKTNTASTVDIGDTKASNTYLFLPYSEEDVIELDININKAERDNNDNVTSGYIMGYEDGVPAKAFAYTNLDIIYQGTTVPNPNNTGEEMEVAKVIQLGSDYCDVRIYRLKLYSTDLTTANIMRNFIADARDTITMVERFNRNAIYYNNNTQKYTPYSDEEGASLDPQMLASRIPDVKVLMLEAPVFTKNKKNFVRSTLRCIHATGGTKYEADPRRDNWLFTNGYHSGQGTTSDKYGISARNVDFLFNCDAQNKPSDKVENDTNYKSHLIRGYGAVPTSQYIEEDCENWIGNTAKVQLTKDSVPNNFFNFKANVASSENVNNALLQKRFNDYLPYTSLAKQRDSRTKNDMEFVPAVLFIRESDENLESHLEFNDTNWHFYALGNLGDSKKTDYSRAYDPDDINEFTIEISDNTPNNAQFQSGVYKDENNQLHYLPFYLNVKWVDEEKKDEVIVEPVATVNITSWEYSIPKEQQDELIFKKGQVVLVNSTGDPSYDSYIDTSNMYLNMSMWCLYNEDFDGDHSFEPRYACCGDYRDGKLVNDNGHGGKSQVKKNNDVWRAFYKWVITASDQEFVDELDQWCNRDAVEFFYAFTHFFTMMDNRAKNTFWHFGKTGNYIPVSKPVKELLHVYCELVNDEYVTTSDTEIDPVKTYYTQYAFDLWDYDNDKGLSL